MAPILRVIALSLVLPLFASAEDRPNVLWIYLEDVSGWFSCYGDELIETPNIDALAKTGVKFDRFYTPAGVCSATRSATILGVMQTSVGAHHHRSARPDFRGQVYEEYDKNVLPSEVKPLPVIFREAGFWTFNEGGKDDYNFEFQVKDFYNVMPGKGWGPAATIGGAALEGKADDQPFFGQIQLGGGKLGKRIPKVIDPADVSVPPYYPDVAETREEIAHHYDCLLETDKQVGQIMDWLKAEDLYENTWVFMFSDHGMMLHRHKQFLYEGGIHMPLVVSGPKLRRGTVREDLISGIDIAPTSLAMAGLDIPDAMEGNNFLAHGFTKRDFVISARDRCDYTYERIRAVVTPEFKYLRNYTNDRPFMNPSYKDGWDVSKKYRAMMAAGEMNDDQLVFFAPDTKPAEELYDLANDPHELHNLAEDPEFAEALGQHRQILTDWIAETGDQGQAVESDMGLLCTMKRWGEKCVNPEYDRVRDQYAAWLAANPPVEKKQKKKK